MDTFHLGISEEKIFIVGVLHYQKRQLTSRIIDKLHIEASELKYQQMANIQLLVLERRKWRMESWASWSQQMQTPVPLLLLCSSHLCLSSFRQAQTCMMSAQRPTQVPQPLRLWLLASSHWPWKQSKAPKSGQLDCFLNMWLQKKFWTTAKTGPTTTKSR